MDDTLETVVMVIVALAISFLIFTAIRPGIDMFFDALSPPDVSQTCLDAGWDTSYRIDGKVFCGADHDDGTGVIYLINERAVREANEVE